MSNLIAPARRTSRSDGGTPTGRSLRAAPRTPAARLLPVRTVVIRTLALPLLLLAFSAAGCTAEVTTRPAGVVTAGEEVYVDAAPVNIYAYPHTVYRGETVYYVDGRWYRRRGPRWTYYRHEPRGLVRHRRYVEAAPPARRYHPAPGEAIRVR